jgi:hypothetical protein
VQFSDLKCFLQQYGAPRRRVASFQTETASRKQQQNLGVGALKRIEVALRPKSRRQPGNRLELSLRSSDREERHFSSEP